MFIYLFLLFTGLPALEFILIIRVGSEIGAVNTLAILILIGLSGAYLARLQGFQTLKNIQQSLEQGILPTENVLDGFLILCGGMLLLTPGFITDVVGILFLVPFTRSLLKILFRKKFQTTTRKGETNVFFDGGTQKKRGYEKYDDADFT